MNGGILFNMAFMWLLHFKMGQTQPLFFQTVQGLTNLVFNPLFQCYVLGRNLERPFKVGPTPDTPPAKDEEQQASASEVAAATTEVPVAEKVKDVSKASEDDDDGDDEDDDDDDDEDDDDDATKETKEALEDQPEGAVKTSHGM
jgi:hypothetical protein